jgi:hypothetical protein
MWRMPLRVVAGTSVTTVWALRPSYIPTRAALALAGNDPDPAQRHFRRVSESLRLSTDGKQLFLATQLLTHVATTSGGGGNRCTRYHVRAFAARRNPRKGGMAEYAPSGGGRGGGRDGRGGGELWHFPRGGRSWTVRGLGEHGGLAGWAATAAPTCLELSRRAVAVGTADGRVWALSRGRGELSAERFHPLIAVKWTEMYLCLPQFLSRNIEDGNARAGWR